MNARVAIRAVSISVVLLAMTALAPSCKPKAGGACAQGQGTCVDAKTMMACVQGKYASMPCQGANGCAGSGASAQCDNTLATAGDPCNEVGDYACQPDMKAALSCKDDKWAIEETCKGERGCKLEKDGLSCDNDISDQGDSCHTIGDYACTSDKLLALRCVDHVMAPLNSCRGAKGCRVFELPQEKKIEFVCDDALAKEGDPCDEEGEDACTMDRKALLKCDKNKYAMHHACPGGCTFEGNGDRFLCEGGGGHAAGTTPAPGASTKPSATPPSTKPKTH